MSLTVKQVAKKVGTTSRRIRRYLQNNPGPHEFSDLASHVGVPVEQVLRAVESMVESGAAIRVSNQGVEVLRDLPTLRSEDIDVKKLTGSHQIFGVTADNHLGSKYARLDVLNALFDIWQERGVKRVLQLGNIIDGEARFNKFDLLVHGMDAQVAYLLENWPHRPGMVTEFVTGDDHEGWYVQREGVDIGRHIQLEAEKAGRTDLVYVGHMERQIAYRSGSGKSIVSMIHAGGGTPYAISYSTQRLVEGYQGGEKPAVLLVGHYHKYETGYPREVYVCQPGCTQDQTPFLRKRKIQAMVGGVTLEFDMNSDALLSGFVVHWHPFYDRDFYKGKQWKYRWREK
jgi:hypothetical protein